MKIITKNQEIENKLYIESINAELDDTKENYKRALKFYGELLDEIYKDLVSLNNSINTKIAKEKIKLRVQDIIIKIGGRL